MNYSNSLAYYLFIYDFKFKDVNNSSIGCYSYIFPLYTV